MEISAASPGQVRMNAQSGDDFQYYYGTRPKQLKNALSGVAIGDEPGYIQLFCNHSEEVAWIKRRKKWVTPAAKKGPVGGSTVIVRPSWSEHWSFCYWGVLLAIWPARIAAITDSHPARSVCPPSHLHISVVRFDLIWTYACRTWLRPRRISAS